MPNPRVTRGRTKVQKSACRLKRDISQVVTEQTKIPTPRIFFGFTFWMRLPTIGMTQSVACPCPEDEPCVEERYSTSGSARRSSVTDR